MASPYPKPQALKELNGSWRSKYPEQSDDPHPGKAPAPEVKAPKPPKILKGESLKEYRRITKLLLNLRVLSEADLGVLVIYCQAYGEMIETERKLVDTGLYITTKTGCVMQHPLVSIRNNAMDRMLKAAIQMGITPSARTRVQVIPEKSKQQDWLDDDTPTFGEMGRPLAIAH